MSEKRDYDSIATEWGALAEITYRSATIVKDNEDAVRQVYANFKEEEEKLFDSGGWTYAEFKEETMRRAGICYDPTSEPEEEN